METINLMTGILMIITLVLLTNGLFISLKYKKKFRNRNKKLIEIKLRIAVIWLSIILCLFLAIQGSWISFICVFVAILVLIPGHISDKRYINKMDSTDSWDIIEKYYKN